MAAYQKEDVTEDKAIEAFQNSLTDKAYGDMYNKYECLIAAEYNGQFHLANELALQEIKNRPTTTSYDLLAWSLFLEGKTEIARNIAINHILNKTSEPDILLHLTCIFTLILRLVNHY